MIRTQVYIPDELYNSLRLLSLEQGSNISILIREGAEEVIRKKRSNKKSDWKKFVGMAGSGIKTNSTKDIADYYTNGIVK